MGKAKRLRKMICCYLLAVLFVSCSRKFKGTIDSFETIPTRCAVIKTSEGRTVVYFIEHSQSISVRDSVYVRKFGWREFWSIKPVEH